MRAHARAASEARALIVGAGGLGVPASLVLLDAGIGALTVYDPDVVALSNLHRQILYTEEDIGQPKVECFARALRRRYPDACVEIRAAYFSEEWFGELDRFDIVLDGTDRFETKLAIADACLDRRVFYVFAGVLGYEGQVLGVVPKESACVRCLFDEAPPPGSAPTCDELGIFGPIAGIVGAKQAEVALAVLSGDEAVRNSLWCYDGRTDRERTVALARMADCRGCGSRTAFRGAGLSFGEPLSTVDAGVVDLSTLSCPYTFIAMRKALEQIPIHGRLWVTLDGEAARHLPVSAIAAGHRVLAQRSDGRTHRVLVERGI